MPAARTRSKAKKPRSIKAVRETAHTRKWRDAAAKAQRTWRWAITMTRVLIKRSAERRAWRVVDFHSRAGFESAGIVDLVVVRRDCSRPSRGDLLELVLVQVKGGAAPWPTFDAITRLRRAAKHHRAAAIVLSVWMKGSMPKLFMLLRLARASGTRREAWEEIADLTAFFSSPTNYRPSIRKRQTMLSARHRQTPDD